MLSVKPDIGGAENMRSIINPVISEENGGPELDYGKPSRGERTGIYLPAGTP